MAVADPYILATLHFQANPQLTSLLNERGPWAGATGLDLGCGGGRDLRAMVNHGIFAIGSDSNVAHVRMARRQSETSGTSFVVLDYNLLPFRRGVFNLIVCMNVLELIPSLALYIIYNLAYYLAQNGTLLLNFHLEENRLSGDQALATVEYIRRRASQSNVVILESDRYFVSGGMKSRWHLYECRFRSLSSAA